MFLELLKLIGRKEYSNKTPLEDFNTECFAGILNLNPNIKEYFIEKVFELPNDSYQIETQLWKNLPDSPNCIIDMAFIGKENICFVENKVEAGQGKKQLLRYDKVLGLHYYKYKTRKLFYITKHSEKVKETVFENCSFEQKKWFEIAKHLKPFKKNNTIIKDYLFFLNHYEMEQDQTFRIENITTINNLLKTIKVVEFHMKNCSEGFDLIFDNYSPKYFFDINELYGENRIINNRVNILTSNNGFYSEILYSIQFGESLISTHIYVSADHEKINDFNKIKIEEPLKRLEMEHGTSIYRTDDLTKYIDKEESDETIKKWYLESFGMMKQLMKDNSDLGWVYKFD